MDKEALAQLGLVGLAGLGAYKLSKKNKWNKPKYDRTMTGDLVDAVARKSRSNRKSGNDKKTLHEVYQQQKINTNSPGYAASVKSMRELSLSKRKPTHQQNTLSNQIQVNKPKLYNVINTKHDTSNLGFKPPHTSKQYLPKYT